MDTRLRNLLHDLATEMPVDVEAGAPQTLRKARSRRFLTAGASVAIVLALVVVSVSALRFGGEPTPAPAVTGPDPAATFEGLWPETDAETLATTQTAVDEGHHPLRTTPDGTASLLAVDLLGWPESDVQIESLAADDDEASVVISNRIFGDPVPPITIELRQLGQTGPNGAWSVVDVSTPLIELDEITEMIAPENPEIMPGFFFLHGSVADMFDGAPAIEANVFDGPSLVPSLGSGRQELTDGRFDFARFGVESTPDGEATLLLTIPDATGASLGAVMVPVETPVFDAGPSGPSLSGLPPDVAATAQRIYDAALAGDVDALAPLLDPNTFMYNFDDGSDPIPAWRADPSVLDAMVALLRLPAAEPREIKGYGTLYIWPYLIDSDFDALTEGERADLVSLGYTDQEIDLMIEGGYGYQGPRLGIDGTGLWRNFTTMGE